MFRGDLACGTAAEPNRVPGQRRYVATSALNRVSTKTREDESAFAASQLWRDSVRLARLAEAHDEFLASVGEGWRRERDSVHPSS